MAKNALLLGTKLAGESRGMVSPHEMCRGTAESSATSRSSFALPAIFDIYAWYVCLRATSTLATWISRAGTQRKIGCLPIISERSSGAAHQARPRAVADLPYRATSHDLSVNVREVVLVVTAQSPRIRHVNLVRRPAALDDPDTTALADPQDRH